MHHSAQRPASHDEVGLTIHGAARYDLLVGLLTLGGEGRLRRKILDLAGLRAGERVLDIGCGTGTLAILAQRRVGPSGSVHGFDASPEMIARAAAKAKRAGLDLDLRKATVQAMPYPDASFDVVLSTFMLHHVPEPARRQMALEIRRVLKPDGRALLVDFGPPKTDRRDLAGHFHQHGFIQIDDIAADLEASGLKTLSGPLGAKGLDFVMAGTDQTVTTFRLQRAAATRRDHVPMALAVVALLAAGLLIALHVGVAAFALTWLKTLPARPLAIGAGVIVTLVLAKVMLFSTAHRFAGKLFARWVGAGGHSRTKH